MTADDRPPFVRGSDTSEGASESMKDYAPRLRRLVYSKYLERDGAELTCDEIEVIFNMRHQTASARIYELVKMGLLIDTGKRRLTRSGRKARVLTAKRLFVGKAQLEKV